MAEKQDVRENWSVTDYGVATPDEVEKALGWIGMEDMALSYRVGACFMRAGAFAAPVDTDGDIAECARRLGWVVSELIDGMPWERRGQVVAALQALGAALWAHDSEASAVLADGVMDEEFQRLHEEGLKAITPRPSITPTPDTTTAGGGE